MDQTWKRWHRYLQVVMKPVLPTKSDGYRLFVHKKRKAAWICRPLS